MIRIGSWQRTLAATFPVMLLFAVLLGNCSEASAAGAFANAFTNMSSPRRLHTATVMQSGDVLIAGGFFDNMSTAVGGKGSEIFNRGSGKFTSTAGSMNPIVGRHTATLLRDGKILIAGGKNSSGVSNALQLFDPATGTYTPMLTTLTTARYNHTATLLNDGKVLICGGQGTGGTVLNSFEVFDPVKDQLYHVTGVMMTARFGHTATRMPDGTVFVIGGFDGTNYLQSTELFNGTAFAVSTNMFQGAGRAEHTATLLANGKVLVVAGRNASGALDNHEVIDPAGTDMFYSSSITARLGHSAVLLPNGKVLITGGIINRSSGNSDLQPYLFDPSLNPAANQMVAETGPMQFNRFDHTVSLLPDGTLLITGGEMGQNAVGAYSPFMPINAVEVYNYQQSIRVMLGTTMTSARKSHTSTLVPSTPPTVLLAGGNSSATTVANSAELFDTTTSTFAGTSIPMLSAHQSHAAVLLPSGKVAIFGGYSSAAGQANYQTTAMNKATIYTPGSGFAAVMGNMTSARGQHTATLLKNGKVLIAGGNKGNNVSDMNADALPVELFDPATGTFTEIASLSVGAGHSKHTATMLKDGRVLIAGGTRYPGSSTNSAVLFDPSNNTLSAPISMTQFRAGHSATLLPDGRVLIVGGYSSLGPLMETFDPVTNSFSPLSVSDDRTDHTATLLPNGMVALIGGYSIYNGGMLTNTVSIFDPVTQNKWTGYTALDTCRYGHTATLLPNGRILIAGGAGMPGPTCGTTATAVELADAETFTPSLGYLDYADFAFPASTRNVPALTGFDLQSAILSGTNFTGDSEASGGGSNGSPANYPLVTFQGLQNDSLSYLTPYGPVLADLWTPTYYQTAPLSTALPMGQYFMTMFTEALTSNSLIVEHLPKIDLLLNGGAVPASITFPNTPTSSTSPEQVFRITNAGTLQLDVPLPQLVGTDPSEFFVSPGSSGTPCTFPQQLSPGAFCDFSLYYSPTFLGHKTATLAVTSNDPKTPSVNIDLTGDTGYTLTINNPDPALGSIEGGVCSDGCELKCGLGNSSCSQLYAEGTPLYFDQFTAAGAFFSGWGGAGASCTGSGTCSITMPNADVTLDAGFCAIANGQFTVSPLFSTLTYLGASGLFSLTQVSGTCSNWTAAGNVPWITITSGANGSGNGSVGYSAAAGSELRGAITAAGQTFDLLRSGNNGGLDPTFNSQAAGFGYATMTQALASSSQFTINASTVQPDGMIVVTGYTSPDGINNNLFVARFTTAGALDTTFGTGGKYEYTNPNGMSSGTGVTIDATGNVVVSGYRHKNEIYSFPPFTETALEAIALRLTSTGTLDTGFNTTGIAAYSSGTTSGSLLYSDMANAVAIDSTGNIVLAGSTKNISSGTFLSQGALLVRFTSAGALDTATFNGSGIATYSTGTYEDVYNALAILADNSILAVGKSKLPDFSYNIVMTKTTSSGSLQTTGFGAGGVVTYQNAAFSYDNAAAIKVQPDGKILVAGSSNSASMLLLRYLDTGVLDTTGFNSLGTPPGVASNNGIGSSVALQSNGKIIVAGSMYNTTNDMAAFRYNADGTLDTTFGVNGVVTFDSPNGADDNATTALIDNNGDIVVAGFRNYYISLTNYHDGLIIRLTRDFPVITWANPADITYGTSLDATQLNATSSVPGTFSYNPVAGTILNAGAGQTLLATFNPSEPLIYNTLTASASINVNKANQTLGSVTFSPASIPLGGTSTVSAIASSGLAVTAFASTTPSICSVSGATVTAIAPGTCTISVDQAGDANYNAATQITASTSVGVCDWKTAVSGNWSDGNNWSCGQAPGVNDNAFIILDGTYTVTLDASATVNSLTVGSASGIQTFQQNTNTLTLNNASSFGTNAVYNLAGGVLTGSGTLDLSGAFNWSGGTVGTPAGTGGILNLLSGSTTSISGPSSKSLDTWTINNAGTIAMPSTSYIYFYNGATFNNNSVFDLQSDYGLSLGTGASAFNNNAGATFKKSAGTATSSVSIPFNNSGTVSIQSGTVNFSGGGSHNSGSSFEALAGATLDFGGGSHAVNAGSISAPAGGTIQFSGSNTVIANGVIYSTLGTTSLTAGTAKFDTTSTTASITNFNVSGGTITGSGTINVSNNFTWTGGSLGSTTGTGGILNLLAGSTTSISSFSSKYIDTWTINNAGTIAMPSTSYVYFYNGATFNNNSIFDLQSDYGLALGTGTVAFNNNAGATFKKTAGTTTSSVSVPFNNSGTVDIQSGTVSFTGDGVHAGTFTAASGAMLDFGGGTHAINSGNINGLGTIQFNGSTSTIAPAVTYAVTGATTVIGGTVNLNTIATTTNLNVGNGILTGTGRLDVSNNFNWSGGTVGSPAGVGGILNLLATSTTSISSFSSKSIDTWTINNAGTITMPSTAYVYFYNGATFNNNSIFDLQSDYGLALGTGTVAFNNNAGATFKKTAGTIASSVSVPFNNSGTVGIQSGTVSFTGGGVHTGTFTAASGAMLDFGGGTHAINSGNINGLGTIQFNGSTSTIAPAVIYAVTGVTNINGGTVNLNTIATTTNLNVGNGILTGTGRLDVSNNFNWSGGTVGSPAGVGGILNLLATSTTSISSFSSKSIDTWTINNAGTIAMPSTSYVYFYNGATFNNNSIFDLQSDYGLGLGTGTVVFNNNAGATFKKSAGSAISYISVPFNNSGTVDIQSGEVSFSGDGSHTGTFTVASGTMLDFSGGTHAVNGGNITGLGAILFNGSTTNLAAAATYNVSGATSVTSGTVNFNNTATTLNLNVSGGTLSGTGSMDVSNNFHWTGGSIGNTAGTGGVLNLLATCGSTFAGLSSMSIDTWAINNSGFVIMPSAAAHVYFYNGAIFNNAGIFDLQSDYGLSLGAGAAAFNNNTFAAFRKSAGTGASFVSIPFNNNGTVESLSGTLSFSNTLLNSSTGTFSGTGTINVASATFTNNGAITPATAGSAGLLTLTGNMPGAATDILNIDIGGTIAGSTFDRLDVIGNATLNGTLNVNLINSFIPAYGDSFIILACGTTCNGAFSTTNLPAVSGGSWSIAYGATATTLNLMGTQTITGFVPPTNATYGDAPITLSATGGASGQPVTFSVVSGPGSITGSTLTITGAGVINLLASQAGNATYAAAPDVPASITVSPALLTITANSTSKTYGQTLSFAGTEFSSSGLKNSETIGLVTLASPGAVSSSTVAGGPYAITAASASSGTFNPANYSITYIDGALTVNPAVLTVSSPAVTSKPFDGTNAAVITGTLSGVITPDVITFTGTGTFASTAVGTGIAVTSNSTISGAAAGNYTLTQPTGLTGNITAMALTISGATVTSKVYDGTNAAIITGTLTGIVSPDVVTLNGTGTFAATTVGTGIAVTSTSTLTGPNAANYTLTQPTGLTGDITALSVTPAVTVNSKTYNGTTVATIATRTLSGVLPADSVNVTLTGGAAIFASANAGTGIAVNVSGLSLTGTAAGNYTLASTTAVTSADITTAPLTVTANSFSKTFGQTVIFAGTEFTSSGLQNAETIGLVSLASSGAAANAAVAGSPYAITASGAGSGTFNPANYAISYVSGLLTVNPAPTIITTTLPNVMVGTPYSQNITVTGGTAPLTFLLATGTLPPGVTLSSTGLLSGTAITPGSYPFTVTVEDANLQSSSMPYTIMVIPPPDTATISGNVSYAGAHTGRIYISVQTNRGTLGTSIAAPGAYSIRGVPNGSYTVSAFMDSLDLGTQVQMSPDGSTTTSLAGTTVTGVNITLTDPSPIAPPTPATVSASTGNGSVLIDWDKPRNSGIEAADSYDIYWNTLDTVSKTNFSGSRLNVPAGLDSPAVIDGLTNGSALYFVVVPKSGGVEGSSSAVFGPITVGPPAGGYTVSGTVNYSGPTPTGPLHVAIVTPAQKGASGVYYTTITNPGATNSFSVAGVPNGSYAIYSIIDMNNDKLFGIGDIMTPDNQTPLITVNGAAVSGIVANLAATSGQAFISTDHIMMASGPGEWFSVGGGIKGQLKRPVAVTLTAAPVAANLTVPMDMGIDIENNGDFRFWTNNSGRPSTSDTYTFTVTYADGTIDSAASAMVTGVIDSFPTNVQISTPTSTIPTFSWGAPLTPPSTYQYNLWVSAGNGFNLWDAWDLPSSMNSAVYGSSGDNAEPLQMGITYNWNVSVRDRNDNQASIVSSFVPTAIGTPVITWSAPTAITYGTALSATQLNATASVPGTFAYSPVSGTVPATGTQTLSVTFTPTDTVNYTTATGSVSLTVNKATPTVSAWPTAAAITAGQNLGSSALTGGSASVPGSFAFTTPSTVPGVGTASQGVTFTPTDSVNYNAASGTISVTVNPASIQITATAASGGTVTPSGTTMVTPGSNQSYTIAANTGYHIADVKIDGVSQGAITSYIFTNVTAPHTIDATFAVNTFTITATANSSGSITPAGATALSFGASQPYSITPNSGYIIADVRVDNASIGRAGSYTFSSIAADHTIEAVFAANGVVDPANTTGVPALGDVLMALTFALGDATPTPAQMLHIDASPMINGVPQPDGKVDLSDVLLLLRRVVGLIPW